MITVKRSEVFGALSQGVFEMRINVYWKSQRPNLSINRKKVFGLLKHKGDRLAFSFGRSQTRTRTIISFRTLAFEYVIITNLHLFHMFQMSPFKNPWGFLLIYEWNSWFLEWNFIKPPWLFGSVHRIRSMIIDFQTINWKNSTEIEVHNIGKTWLEKLSTGRNIVTCFCYSTVPGCFSLQLFLKLILVLKLYFQLTFDWFNFS